MTFAVVIHQEQMITRAFGCGIQIFTHFNVAISAQNNRAAITPSRETERRQPTHAMITSGTVAADYRQITKVFAFRELRVIIIDNFGRLNGGGGINWCRPRIVRSDGCQYHTKCRRTWHVYKTTLDVWPDHQGDADQGR